MNILISGLNNYVARRCTSLMADADFHLFAITRNKKLYESHMFEPIRAAIFELNLMLGGQRLFDLPKMDAALYFTQVSALDDQINLRMELLCLRNFIQVVQELHCNRIIYVARIMDRRDIQPIVDLLEEFKINYTVILKHAVLGKDCLVYKVSLQISERNLFCYTSAHKRKLMQPLGIHDFIRWLKSLLAIPTLQSRIMEVGGEERISAMDLYQLYRKLKQKLQQQRLIALPDWLFKFVYRRFIQDYGEIGEYFHLIKANKPVENHWKSQMPFMFSPIHDILLAE